MGKPEEPWFATGVAMILGGSGLLGLTWQTTDGFTEPKPYQSWITIGSVALIGAGVLVALFAAGLRVPRARVRKVDDPDATTRLFGRQIAGMALIQRVLNAQSGEQDEANLREWMGSIDGEVRSVSGVLVCLKVKLGRRDLLHAAHRRLNWTFDVLGNRGQEIEREGNEPRQWFILHPLVVDGNLRFTLRHATTSDRNHPFMVGVSATVEGPDGTFTNVRATRSHDEMNGVYLTDYPRDFEATRLRPGVYTLRWNALTRHAWSEGDPPSIVIAATTVRVTDDWRVEHVA